eukprot:TRINITY_DN4623_c0_g1_i6.p1 TRINITY_DN4623_c0_g1~~TRINITY_DN4623_c0_g1_i6.p1  ORF type:complete len:874 (+),score=126.78 TRINITY_DN4623_c0_g1_i6:391-2622(+)
MAVNSPNQSCAGLPHGSVCGTTCPAGYELKGEKVICHLGNFQVPFFGCVADAVDDTEEIDTALSFQMRMSVNQDISAGLGELEAITEQREFIWANREVFAVALAKFGVPPEQLFIIGVTIIGDEAVNTNMTQPRRLLERARARLLQYGAIGIELDCLIEVRPDDDLQAIQDVLAQAEDRTSNLSLTVMENILEEFESRDIEVPAILKAATLATSGVTTMQNIEVPASAWVVTPWTWCSNACGTGNRTRSVECSTGNPAACALRAVEPAAMEVCEDFDACEYDPWCPLGRGSSVSCVEQASIVTGSFFVPTGLFVLCVLRAFQVKLRRPTEGAVLIKNAKELGEIPWYSIKDENDAKVHISWDLSHVELQDKVDEVLKADSAKEAVSQSDSYIMALVQQRSEAVEAVADDDEPSSPFLQLDNVDIDVSPYAWMYELDQRVEYYSATHRMWLSGKVSNVSITAVPRSTVIYDITLMQSQQVRECVPLELLRPLFVEGEPCSFFAPRDDRWLPAVIYGAQPAVCTRVGYTIKLESGSQDELPVPASRLRRRFPAGCLVEAYVDEVDGWVQATVVQEQVQENVELLASSWECVLRKDFGRAHKPGSDDSFEVENGAGSLISVHDIVSGLAGGTILAPKSEERSRMPTPRGKGPSQAARMPTPRGKGPSQAAPTRLDGAELCRWSLVDLSLDMTGENLTLPSFRLRHVAAGLQEMRKCRNEEFQASERLALASTASSPRSVKPIEMQL